MASAMEEVVEDRKGLLTEADHMRDMERLEMQVTALDRPFRSVVRVTGRIAPKDPAAWALPNCAVRIEVESPPGVRPVSRVYTIRSFDPASRLVEIDFVVHDDDSPAMRWLHAAAPGTRVWMTGPRQHFVPNHAPGRRVAMFADETAIPAIHALLQDWPAGAEGRLWVETCDPAAFAELPVPPGVRAELLLRGADEPAGSTNRLLAAAKTLAGAGGWTLWAAGERQEMRALRSHIQALGFGRDDARVFGYWKRGTSSSEIDRVRLAEYAALRERGGALEDFADADLPI